MGFLHGTRKLLHLILFPNFALSFGRTFLVVVVFVRLLLLRCHLLATTRGVIRVTGGLLVFVVSFLVKYCTTGGDFHTYRSA